MIAAVVGVGAGAVMIVLAMATGGIFIVVGVIGLVYMLYKLTKGK